MLNGVLALANLAYLIAFSRSDRLVLVWLLCAELIALCCAVLNCTVLRCAVCAVLYCAVLCCAVLCLR